jgi:hypothetical protein
MKQKGLALFIVILLLTITTMVTAKEDHLGSQTKNIKQAPPLQSSTVDWSLVTRLNGHDSDNGDLFATSVAIDGNYVLIGAPQDDTYKGSAYFYTKNGDDWTETQKIMISDDIDEVGAAVALSGDTAVIAAPGWYGATGAVYIFIRTDTTWTQQAKLTASDGSMSDYFGSAVAISGDTVVIGASNKNNYTGEVYIFTRTGTTWTQDKILTAPSGLPNDYYGYQLDIDQTTILIGACGENGHTGAAYVYIRGDSTWEQEARLTAADGTIDNYFGIAVSLSGNTLVACAPWNNDMLGAAYIFTRTGTNWTQTQKIAPIDPTTFTGFGFTCSLDGNFLAIGAPFGNNYKGEMHVFKCTHGAWSEDAILFADDGAENEDYGDAVSLDHTTLLVGAPSHDYSTGEAYMYYKPVPEFQLSIAKPKVTISITNIGDADATNLNATISLTGGFILVGKTSTQTFTLLAQTDSKTIGPGTVFGFGKTTVAVTVSCDEGTTAQATASAKVFLFFVFGVQQNS